MNERYGLILLILIPAMLLLSAALTVSMAWNYGKDVVLTELDEQQTRDCESLFRLRLPASAKSVGFHMRLAGKTVAHWRLTMNAAELPALVKASPFAEAEWRVLPASTDGAPLFPDWWTPTALSGTRTATTAVQDKGERNELTIWAAELPIAAASMPAATDSQPAASAPAASAAAESQVAVFLEWRRD